MPKEHPPLRHLKFNGRPRSVLFASGGGGGGSTPLFHGDRDAHARFLRSEVAKVQQAFDQTATDRSDADLSAGFGLTLNVVSEPDSPLLFERLDSGNSGESDSITLLNVRRENTKAGVVTKAAIFVPFGELRILEQKIEAYADPAKDSHDQQGNVTNPRNAPLLANIASISVAAFEALWTDPEPIPNRDIEIWFELWIRREVKDWEAQLREEGERLGIEIPEQKLILPEHIVLVVRATRRQLESSLDFLNTLSEVRVARPCSVGLTDLTGIEQEEWIDEALSRIQWPEESAPSVCLIDSGVNRAHPLIEPLLASEHMETVFGDGDKSDDLKHGTPMAGLAAFGDLRNLMLSTGMWEQLHRLESVKLIRGSSNHDPENYGALTMQAIALPDVESPDRSRVFCMALTASGPNTEGNPTSWSSAVDMAAAGTDGEDQPSRVIILSAGNFREFTNAYEYPEDNYDAAIEDPAQAWNAVTVGAVTTRINIEEDSPEAQACTAIAPEHGLSPFSRTSREWRTDWPVGPDVVVEGGNLSRAQDGSLPLYDSLQLLSTATNFTPRPLAPFNATSAAAAQVARVGARIRAAYPGFRAETVRGLIVHSARWPQVLLDRERIDPHAAGRTQDVERLMRSYGYGVVSESRAIASLQNKATVVFENQIQPYRGEWNDVKLNECHLVALPWPKDLLLGHPNQSATLRVTLSYFIEPNPGSRTWEKSQKYHYASSLLRFRPKHSGISDAQFQASLDAEATGRVAASTTDPGWAVGGTRRGKSGSLVQDVWKGTTDQLATMGHIGIYPAKGWWAYRRFKFGHELHGCHLKPVNYSLIISLETETDLPIYNEIETAIQTIEAGIDLMT